MQWSYLIEQVWPINAALEVLTSLNLQNVFEVLTDIFSCCCCQGYERDCWELLLQDCQLPVVRPAIGTEEPISHLLAKPCLMIQTAKAAHEQDNPLASQNQAADATSNATCAIAQSRLHM